jgi:hypothetical protein
MFKNVASQKVALFAFDTTTGAPKTGDGANITPYVSKDYGVVTTLGTATATEMDATNAKGWYSFVLAQAETNADALLFSGKSVTANVSVVGALIYTTPPNFSALSISATGIASVTSNVKKNQALAGFTFIMTDSTNHNPATGKTVTAQRSLDGAALGAASNTVVEISNGLYKIDLAAADVNGNVVLLRFTATGCDDRDILIITQP